MVSIRPAEKKDIPLILQLIRDLAEYEREPQAAIATEADLLRDGFKGTGDDKFRVLIAEDEGKPAGFAFFFYNYSTWLGRPGIYLEDLFVRPAFRGRGIGKKLLARIARIALDEDCYGIRWEVLDWNTPAIDFYESLRAGCRAEWKTFQVKGDALRNLAVLPEEIL